MNDSTEPDRAACAWSDWNEEKPFGSGTWNEVTKIFRDLTPDIHERQTLQGCNEQAVQGLQGLVVC